MTKKILTAAALRDWDTPERIADNFARKAGLLR